MNAPIVIPVVAGILAHVAFNRFEPLAIRPRVTLLLLVGCPAAISIYLFNNSNTSLTLLSIFPLYYFSLLTSLCLYRLSPFHPLARYPGPLLFKLSRFPAWYLVRRGDQHKYYQALHERYGPYVRTGPNHIHISDAAAISPVLASPNFRRGGRYSPVNIPAENSSLISISDPRDHSTRRRLWDHALNPAAIKQYDTPLTFRVSQLVNVIRKNARDGPVDISQWFSFFAFDFMGDMAHGSTFNLMKEGKDYGGFLDILSRGVQEQEYAGAIPWSKPYYGLITRSGNENDLRMRHFAGEMVSKRQKLQVQRKDLFSYLLDEEGMGSRALPLTTLVSEASLVFIAGSDTTSTTLTNTFYYLMSHPTVYRRLQKEVDAAAISSMDPGSEFDFTTLANMPYLNAVINETLRLQPVVANGVPRVLIPESPGVTINGHFIPPCTTVQVSTYIVHRNPAHFSPRPDDYLPERWLQNTEEEKPLDLVKGEEFHLDKNAYFPWSYGPTSCAGKHLATLELRLAIATLVSQFEFRFPEKMMDGWTPEEYEKSLKDRFVLLRGSLPTVVESRKGGKD